MTNTERAAGQDVTEAAPQLPQPQQPQQTAEGSPNRVYQEGALVLESAEGAVHDSPPTRITQLFRGLETRGKQIFDGACGKGDSSNALQSLGFEVTCSAYQRKPKLNPGIHCLMGVDLNKRLPIEDGAFDHASLQEVFEHLENPAHTVREFNRILKPGGLWGLTAPNASCLRSRLHFLLTGFVKGRWRSADYDNPPGNYKNLFIPALPTLHYLMWQYGFRLERVGRSQRRPTSYLLYALLWPLVMLRTLRFTRPLKRFDTPAQREANAELRRILTSPHVLLDENLVLLFRKQHEVGELYNPGS